MNGEPTDYNVNKIMLKKEFSFGNQKKNRARCPPVPLNHTSLHNDASQGGSATNLDGSPGSSDDDEDEFHDAFEDTQALSLA